MSNTKKAILITAFLTFTCFLLWFFSNIVSYFLIALILSFVCHPIYNALDKIKIKNIKLPRAVSALISLAIVVGFIISIFTLLVPVLFAQANLFTNIDFYQLSNNIRTIAQPLENKLIEYKFMMPNETIVDAISSKVISLINMIDFTYIINYIFSFTGSLLIGVFAIIFIAFFLIKDENLFNSVLVLLTPTKYQYEIQNILSNTKKMLTRYFIGLLIDLSIIITFYAVGLSIFGIKNALLIAVIGGILHLIPYLGPIIAIIIGIILSIASNLATNHIYEIFPVITTIIGVFLSANIIDNFVIQPYIYSTSVKTHPLEIFIVVLSGENIAGIPGMILAIPCYTLIKIIAKEFFIKFRIVQKLTENI